MSHKKRRFIFWIFVFLFCLITFWVSLIASGRRLSFQNPRLIERTGLLFIESIPSGAKIYLNNGQDDDIKKTSFFSKSRDLYSPVKIKNLAPDKYFLRLELENYWPWQKEIYINPGQSLFLEKIVLLQKNQALLILPGPPQKIELLSSAKHLLLTEEKKSFNWEKEIIEDTRMESQEDKNKNLEKAGLDPEIWSTSKDLVFYSQDFEIYSLNSHLKSYLEIRESNEITGLTYDPRGYLIYATEKKIKMIELANRRNIINLLEAENINNIILRNDRSLYFSATINNESGLYKLSVK